MKRRCILDEETHRKEHDCKSVDQQAERSLFCVGESRNRWIVHADQRTFEVGPNIEDSVESCDTEEFSELRSDITEDQPTAFFSQLLVEIQHILKAITHEGSNGLTVEDNIPALSGIDNGYGFIQRIRRRQGASDESCHW